MENSAILSVKNVVKTFGGVRALNGVTLNVREGAITMIIGPNGSGKTTLINVVSGVYKPDSGRVFFQGRDITGLPPHEIYRLGAVRTFQIPQPFTKLTVLENLLVAYRGNPGESLVKSLFRESWEHVEEDAVEKAFRMLELLKLGHLWDQQSCTLSGGQMKLLEVGRALMSGAKLLMMDEPAAGVNPVLAHEIFARFRELKEQLGVTFLLIEHRLEIALKYTDYVYAMANGVVVSEGKPEMVMADPKVIEAYLGE